VRRLCFGNVFYAAISAKSINKCFDASALDLLTNHKIKTDLYPVIRKKEIFDLDSTKKLARSYVAGLMQLTESETEFLNRFEKKEYRPELLF